MEKYLDIKVLVTLIVFVIVLLIVRYLWMRNSTSKPGDKLTQAQYDALSAADKANYIDDPNSEFWIKKS